MHIVLMAVLASRIGWENYSLVLRLTGMRLIQAEWDSLVPTVICTLIYTVKILISCTK